jgi:DNA-binding NtrC family response regulator
LSQDTEIFSAGTHGENGQSYSRRKLFERRQNVKFDAPFNQAKNQVIDHFEQCYLTWLISNSKGNVTQAADIAQKERRALGKLLKKHHINPHQYRSN